MKDEQIEAMLCRWASAKYNVQATEVSFCDSYDGPLSDVTPDIDTYIQVNVRIGQRERRFEELYSGDLIRDILKFALTVKS